MSQIVPSSSLLDSADGFWVQNIYKSCFKGIWPERRELTGTGVIFLPACPSPLPQRLSLLPPSLSRGPVKFGTRPVDGPSQIPRHRALLGLTART